MYNNIKPSKDRRYKKTHIDNSLRNILEQHKNRESVAVLYHGSIVGIGKGEELLETSSRNFMSLFTLNVKEVVDGRTLYLIV